MAKKKKRYTKVQRQSSDKLRRLILKFVLWLISVVIECLIAIALNKLTG